MRWTEADLLRHQQGLQIKAAKPAKYRNERIDGFDSKKELAIWQQLELRAKAGEITELQRQIPYALIVNGVLICTFIADFRWREGERLVVADCKSSATRKIQTYRIKAKLMKACYGLDVEEM